MIVTSWTVTWPQDYTLQTKLKRWLHTHSYGKDLTFCTTHVLVRRLTSRFVFFRKHFGVAANTFSNLFLEIKRQNKISFRQNVTFKRKFDKVEILGRQFWWWQLSDTHSVPTYWPSMLSFRNFSERSNMITFEISFLVQICSSEIWFDQKIDLNFRTDKMHRTEELIVSKRRSGASTKMWHPWKEFFPIGLILCR